MHGAHGTAVVVKEVGGWIFRILGKKNNFLKFYRNILKLFDEKKLTLKGPPVEDKILTFMAKDQIRKFEWGYQRIRFRWGWERDNIVEQFTIKGLSCILCTILMIISLNMCRYYWETQNISVLT